MQQVVAPHMAAASLTLSVVAAHILAVKPVMIISLWAPDTLENGTESSAVLDCVYNFTEQDRDSLEVKWYWRHGLHPIYQWLPPNSPQVLDKQFLKHIEPEFSITNDNFTRHRALNLVNLSTTLSGVYSCRVSSNHGDSFKSKSLTIYSQPRETKFYVEATEDGKANITCIARWVYPQPRLRLLRTTEWGTLQDLSGWAASVTSWYEGAFHQRTHLTVPLISPGETLATPYVRDNELLQCEVTIPETSYKEILYQHWKVEGDPKKGLTSASGCRLMNGASISILQFCLYFSYCLGAFTR